MPQNDVIYDDAAHTSRVKAIIRRQLDEANRPLSPAATTTQTSTRRSKKRSTPPPPRKSLNMLLNEQYVTGYGRAHNTNQNNRNVSDVDDDTSKKLVRAVVQRVQQRR